MKPSAFAAEADLCALLIPWLEARNFRCYFEVAVGTHVADIVAVREVLGLPQFTVIEAKLGLCLRLLAQADRFRGSCHRVAIALPTRQLETIESQLAQDWCRWRQIGMLAVSPAGTVTEILPAVEQQTPNSSMFADYLHPEQQTYAAPGNAEGKRSTRYQHDRDRIITCVEQRAGHKGLSVRQIVALTGLRPDAVRRIITGGALPGLIVERHGVWRVKRSESVERV